jgi:nicotinamide-nucleotide amidase
MNWVLAGTLFSTIAVGFSAGNATPQAEKSAPLQYYVIVTGGELLEGVYPDAHTPFLTRALRPLGCQCVGSTIVDDKREDMLEVLRFATNRAGLVIVTGGLGPTPNDMTRETLSQFTGIPLREHEDVLRDMERRFQQPRNQLRANLRRQCLVPSQGGYFKNLEGTAVGLVFDHGASVVLALPGPPRELQSMVETDLIPFVQRRFGVREFGTSLTLRFVGVGQSLIDQTIKDHLRIPPEVLITSLFESGQTIENH